MTSPKIEAVACLRKRALENVGCGDEVYLYSPESADDDDALIYSQATVDALLEEVEVQRIAADHWFTQANASHNRAERAEAEAEANRKDAERLDWMTKKAHDLVVGPQGLWHVLASNENPGHTTPRAAIDAALEGRR